VNRVTTTSNGRVAINTDGLGALRRELALAPSKRVHVGVLGGNDARNGDESKGYIPGNAEIGLAHEYGVVAGASPYVAKGVSKRPTKAPGMNLPERSFLRMPLITRLPEAILKEGRQAWRNAILTKGVVYALRNLGALAESVVQDAFATGGFGTWVKLKASTIRRKKSSAILIDKAELRQSITSRVVG
jgi:hypothetical protein